MCKDIMHPFLHMPEIGSTAPQLTCVRQPSQECPDLNCILSSGTSPIIRITAIPHSQTQGILSLANKQVATIEWLAPQVNFNQQTNRNIPLFFSSSRLNQFKSFKI
jgi:hypothetical protein